MIERARWYSDLAIYYLEASYICEEVGNLGYCELFNIDWNSGYHPVAQFTIIPQQIEKLEKRISNFICLLAGEDESDE